MWQYNYSPELYHYGVMGMRWGHRKQRPVSMVRTFGQGITNLKNADKKRMLSNSKNTAKAAGKIISRKIKENNPWNKLSDRQKKVVKIGAAVAGAALLTYGAYKLKKGMAYRHEAKIKDMLNRSFNKTNESMFGGSSNVHKMEYTDKYTGERVSKMMGPLGSKREAAKYIKRHKMPGTSYNITKGKDVTVYNWSKPDLTKGIYDFEAKPSQHFYTAKEINRAVRKGYRLH